MGEDALGIGLEMIMEAWGFEFPFNNQKCIYRQVGTAVAALFDRAFTMQL